MKRKMILGLLSIAGIVAGLRFLPFKSEISLGEAEGGEKAMQGYYEAVMNAQAKAVDANEVLYASFDFEQTYVYPEDFSGAYVTDEGEFVILLTSFENVEGYKDLLEDYLDIISFETVSFSQQELLDISHLIGIEADKNLDVSGFGPDVMNNGILLDLRDKANQENESLLEQVLTKDEYGYTYTFSERVCPVTVSWEAYETEEVSYYGGSPLGLSSTFNCETMAGNGYRNNSLGFVTCGHGQSLGHMMYSSGSFVGVTAYISFPTVSNPTVYGDFSFINAASMPGQIIAASKSYYNLPGSTLLTYVGKVSNPPVGTMMFKYGKNSGKTTLQVSAQGLTRTEMLSDGTTGYVNGISSASIINGTSQGGDSGGPYVYESKFAGVHRGSNVASGGSTVYFTPCAYVQSQSITVYTN